ncbi:hypothetical protein F0L68_40365 [Solihabitans fulvus]|uniref:Uncharacterized protein n=1 Tax=Solihabitans fulvus TaxID=1892852 RepID=A0A5B2W7G4_9PSEU|nr:hypothetical protein [Solihabitans fulvus]KAA2247174.1 hypothetical protein F0L68_40365 [Solihabitans fulvus]
MAEMSTAAAAVLGTSAAWSPPDRGPAEAASSVLGDRTELAVVLVQFDVETGIGCISRPLGPGSRGSEFTGFVRTAPDILSADDMRARFEAFGFTVSVRTCSATVVEFTLYHHAPAPRRARRQGREVPAGGEPR